MIKPKSGLQRQWVHLAPAFSGSACLVSVSRRYWPVKLASAWATSSGVPSATIWPPRSPLRGPRSMLASALLHQSFPQSPRARLRARGGPHLLEDVPDMLVSREERDVQGNRNLTV